MLFHLSVIIPNEYYICFVVDIAKSQGYVLLLLLGEVRKSDNVPQAGLEDPPASDSGLQTPSPG